MQVEGGVTRRGWHLSSVCEASVGEGQWRRASVYVPGLRSVRLAPSLVGCGLWGRGTSWCAAWFATCQRRAVELASSGPVGSSEGGRVRGGKRLVEIRMIVTLPRRRSEEGWRPMMDGSRRGEQLWDALGLCLSRCSFVARWRSTRRAS